MNSKSRAFKAVDILIIIMMILPAVFGIVLNVLTKPQSDEISVSGARVFFTIPMPIQDLPITESQVNSVIVILTIFWLCIFLTHGIKKVPDSKRQLLAEWIVETTEKMTTGNMGEYFSAYAPFMAAIMGLSAFSSLLTLIGLYPPTSDINIVGGWALLVFFLITYYKFKCGPIGYLKSFVEPVALLAPLNIISEFATPVSMAFRHYGNVLSGSVISIMVGALLQWLTKLIFGWLPGFLGQIPFLQIGLPAILSLYFDIFSGCLQAFIFAMLTMLYVSGAFPIEEYFEKKNKKKLKNGGV